MKKRIALLGIYHETNTFSKRPTTLEDFRSGYWLEEDAITREYRGAHHEISGIIDEIDRSQDFELVPVFYAYATPGGIVTADAFDTIISRLFELYDKNSPYDGILVVPHGAGVAESHPDMDGYWLQKLRETIGPELPIIGTLDPHANVSPRMVQVTNGLFPYQTNPHIDQAAVGREAARMLVAMLSDNRVFQHTLVQLPVAISIEQQDTSESPCIDLLAFAKDVKERLNLYAVSLVLGFPYADVPEMGSAFIVIGETTNPKQLEEAKNELAAHIHQHINSLNGVKKTIDEWIPALQDLEKPVLLLDMGDNVGGGSSAQSTHLLEALDRARLSGLFICIYAPEAVQLLERVAPETPETLAIGNNGYTVFPESHRMIAGRFKEVTPKHGGFVNYDMGPSAIVKTKNGQTLMLTSQRTVPYSLQQLLAYGLSPSDFNFIVAKGVNAPIAAYKHVCRHLIKVDTPGETSADMTRFQFRSRRSPLFPFEVPDEAAFG